MMTIHLVMSLFFMWLLTASNGDNVTTTQEFKQMSDLAHNDTQSITGEENKTEPSLLTSSQATSPSINTAATPTIFKLPQFNTMSKTESNTTTSATTAVTRHSSIPTVTWLLSTLTSSTHEQKTHPNTALSTELNSTVTTFTQPTNRVRVSPYTTSTSTSSVTSEVATPSIGTSKTTTKMPLIHITEAKRGDTQGKKSSNSSSHSKVVAGLIGGALVLMMVGFLLIYIKKQKLHRQQLTTTDWAGPSPFLEGGADNSQVTLRSSNLISFSSFLPQRLSKRLSQLPDIEEKHEATTFGVKCNGSTFGQEGDGITGNESDEIAAGLNEDEKPTGLNEDKKPTGLIEDEKTTGDNLVISSPNNNADVSKQAQEHPADTLTPSGLVENATK